MVQVPHQLRYGQGNKNGGLTFKSHHLWASAILNITCAGYCCSCSCSLPRPDFYGTEAFQLSGKLAVRRTLAPSGTLRHLFCDGSTPSSANSRSRQHNNCALSDFRDQFNASVSIYKNNSRCIAFRGRVIKSFFGGNKSPRN